MMARIVRILGCLALAVGLAGCFWPQSGAGPNRQAHNGLEDDIGVATVARLQRAWAAPVDQGPVGDPVTSDRRVHVADTHSVYGFNLDTGARDWEHAVAPPLVVTQPFVRGGNEVLVGQWNPTATPTTDPSVSDVTVSLDAGTGTSAGEVFTGVLAGEREGRALRWELGFIRLGMAGQYPFWQQNLNVVDLATGTVECCFGWFGLADPDVPPPPAPPMTFGSQWIVHAGPGILDTALPPTEGNGVRGFSHTAPQSCFGAYYCPTWMVPTDGTSTTAPVLSDDQSTAYVGTDAGTLYAVSTADGTVLWTAAVGSAVTDTPALAQGRLYVPSASGDLVVLDAAGCGAATCSPLWSGSTGSAITQQPAVANGVVFTGSQSGALRAFAAAGCGLATCEPLWIATVNSEITGAPAVSGGRLFAGTADGRLVAWTLAND